MPASLTVPSPFDVIIDGQGYIYADLEHDKALFGNTPTFVSRQNQQQGNIDESQDFWYSFTQKDWSLGEQRKYARQSDEDASRQYWRGKNVDIHIPGEVSIRKTTSGITPAAAIKCAVGNANSDVVYYSTSTNLYHVDYAGTIIDDGAHGLGAAPSRFGIAAGSVEVLLSTTTAGTVGVRRWNGTAFATFSATAADSLAILNNALYGFSEAAGTLIRYDTAGVATTLYTWQKANGAAVTGVKAKLVPLGGKLLILRYREGASRGAELWLYDGTAPAKIAEFPSNFAAYDMEVVQGTVVVSGALLARLPSGEPDTPTIFFYKDGNQGSLWKAVKTYNGSGSSSSPPLAAFDGGFVFIDPTGYPGLGNPRLAYYELGTGAISTLAELTGTALSFGVLASATSFFLYSPSNTATTDVKLYPASGAGSYASSAAIDSSLIDFDSSLPKVIRSVRVFFDTGTGGDGGSVDLSYRLNDVASSTGVAYTSLATGISSGQEYTLPVPAEGTTYNSISVRVTLNIGTANFSPILKRLMVRGIPVLPAYKKRTYVLNCTGRDGVSPVVLRDDSLHALDGKDMLLNLQTAAARTSPFTIKDHLDPTAGFTGRFDEAGLEAVEVRPEEWIVKVHVREV